MTDAENHARKREELSADLMAMANDGRCPMDATDDGDERCPEMLPCSRHGDVDGPPPAEAPRWFRKKVEGVLFGDTSKPEVAIHGRFDDMNEWECGGILVRCVKRLLEQGTHPTILLMLVAKIASDHRRG